MYEEMVTLKSCDIGTVGRTSVSIVFQMNGVIARDSAPGNVITLAMTSGSWSLAL